MLLGEDQSANPLEYVLHALAGCLTTSLVYHAAAGGYKITEVESKLEGDLDLHGFLGMDDKVRNDSSFSDWWWNVLQLITGESASRLLSPPAMMVFNCIHTILSVSKHERATLLTLRQAQGGE